MNDSDYHDTSFTQMYADKVAADIISREIKTFLKESLIIEGIHREPTEREISATYAFLNEDGGNYGELDSYQELLKLQAVYTPGFPIRTEFKYSVQVGPYVPVPGGREVIPMLLKILQEKDPYIQHVKFELLHPFMDGNGRVGRSLWAKTMMDQGKLPFKRPFLHEFYYQTLYYYSCYDRPIKLDVDVVP